MRIYTYTNCDTCRRATKWLKERGLEFEEIPIREKPPTKAELKKMLGIYKGEVRRLFNTSGQDYKAMDLKDKLPGLGAEEAMDLLAGNGNLVKRPFVVKGDVGVVGFKEEEWEKFFNQPGGGRRI